ncbi:hypothetical protein C1884_05700 [Pseudomonas sp. GW460-R15]|nr:hypothetical protein C1887_18950 [Pseudomonas sp. GW456-R21]POA70135.1 hypothetical protein C1884_05700 [Pseudomonas sp. GW460-R15]
MIVPMRRKGMPLGATSCPVTRTVTGSNRGVVHRLRVVVGERAWDAYLNDDARSVGNGQFCIVSGFVG